MIWRHKREIKLIEPKQKVNSRLLELQTAKEILAEIFQVRPADVEDMIQIRLEERSWAVEQKPQSDEGLWPAVF